MQATIKGMHIDAVTAWTTLIVGVVSTEKYAVDPRSTQKAATWSLIGYHV
jgi:hypothetical protein